MEERFPCRDRKKARWVFIECLEARQLLSVTIPKGYVLVHTATLSSTSSATQQLSPAMPVGAELFLVSSGTVKIGAPNRLSDTSFFDDINQSGQFTRAVVKPNGRYNFSGVSANGWGGAYQSDHVYGQYARSNGAALTATFNDAPLTDNSGSLTLDIYRLVGDVVNSTGDSGAKDATQTPWTGSFNSEDAPEVTLRSLIEYDNEASDPVDINFNIPSNDPGYDGSKFDIATSNLPNVEQSITIDGASQPGYGGSPIVAVDGDGFQLEADSTTIEGLAIINARVAGVYVDGVSDSTITNNFIGIDADGSTAAGNEAGVFIYSGASNTISSNVISGNVYDGVWISGSSSTNNTVSDNEIGVDQAGELAVPNGEDGVLIDTGANDNTVDSNVISGNTGNGVHLTDSDTNNNTISNNEIGTNGRVDSPVANGQDGVLIDAGASFNIVDSDTISGNSGNGVHLDGSDTIENTISNAEIGTNDAGGSAIANALDGVLIANGAAFNTLNSNTISGNTGNGVRMTGSNTRENTVSNTGIGTNDGGDTAVSNGGDGVLIDDGAAFNTVDSDTISGNSGNGVRLSGSGTDNNTISNNEIGTNATGDDAVANDQDGVLIEDGAAFNTVDSNTISGNTNDGVHISDLGSNQNTISNNEIGANDNGDDAIANGQDGVLIEDGADSNLVGVHDGQGQGNTISGNGANGVRISGNPTSQNIVAANDIGVQSDGNSPLPNGQSGILVENDAGQNLIGSDLDGNDDSAEGNVIAFNPLDGATITSGVQNAIHQNSIFSNGRLGINLGGSATTLPNDDKDPDNGANTLQNYPQVTDVLQNGAGGTDISGSLNSTPNSGFHIELYGNDPTADTRWYVEGRQYLGSTDVVTDANGNATFSLTISGAAFSVTATATDAQGNTSEFGIGVGLTAYRTGGNFGQAVSTDVKRSNDPSKYVVLVNDNYDRSLTSGLPDDAGDTAPIQNDQMQQNSDGTPLDPDFGRLTLKLPRDLMAGMATLSLSDPSAMQLFKPDGTKLNDLTLNLSSPSGDLQPLASGSMDIWFEALKADPNFTFKLTYVNPSGSQLAQDQIHINLVNWSFMDGNGNDVQYLPHIDTTMLQYVADNANYTPSTSINDPDDFVTLQLAGLDSSSGESFKVSSDDSSSKPIQDVLLKPSDGLTTSVNKIGLYSADDNILLLADSEIQSLQQTFHIDVVHNPKATVTLQGQWDEQHRQLQVMPKIDISLDKQVVKVGDIIKASLSVETPNPNFTYQFALVVGQASALGNGPNADVSVTPNTAGRSTALVLMKIFDKNGKLIGMLYDANGPLVYAVGANTSAATMQWTQQALDALRVNGDAVPGYPLSPPNGTSTTQLLDLNNRISHAYATMYDKSPDAYSWCGLAAYVSNRGGQGIAAAGMLDAVFRGLLKFPNAVAPKQMYDAFTSLNFTIFMNMYPQFIAYDSGGINAIQAMFNEGIVAQGQLDAWKQIDAGKQAKSAGNAALASQDFWAGNLQLASVEQNIIAQAIYDNYKPLFLFLSNDPWFSTQLTSPVPGSGRNNTFGAVVPNGVHGGQANIAEKDDRWQWVSAANVGIWAMYEAWQPTHMIITAADVTNLGAQIPPLLPTGQDILNLATWTPPS